MEIYTLKTGKTVEKLYSNLDAEKLEKIKQYAVDGFSEDELQKMEADNIDTSLIKNNSKKTTAADNKTATTTKTKTDKDVASRASELKAKYCSNIESSNMYSSSNPALIALKKALDDGLMKTLSSEGYSKTQVIEIVSKAFDVGISNNPDGTYNVPQGHDSEATAIYEQFKSDLIKNMSPEAQELNAAQQKLSEINNQISSNNNQLKQLEYNIVSLQSKLEKKIENAIKESDEIADEQKDEAAKIVSEQLNAYTSANGEMTYDQFTSNVSSALDNLAGESNSKLSMVVGKILEAQSDLKILDNYLSSMKDIIDSNASLTEESKATQDEIKSLQDKIETNAANGDSDCNECDPIGFTTSSGVRYDFFVDNDNNNDITNEQEFLGYQNGFQELIDVDSDGDKKVNAAELDNKNVKVIVTKADGTQEIKKASEVFSDSDSIDLSSYREKSDTTSDGNKLLGSFDVNYNGKTAQGYQTLDSIGWLDDNFEFSDEVAGTGRFAQGGSNAVEALDYSEKYNIFMQKRDTYENDVNKAMKNLNLNSAEIDNITSSSAKQASASGQTIDSEIKTEEEIAMQAEEQKKLEEELKEEQKENNFFQI